MMIDPLTNEVRLIPYGGDLHVILTHMQRNGSSVVLNWGEDTEQWECSWITGGERYTTFSGSPTQAARDCLRQVYD